MKTAAQLMPCKRQRGFSLVELMIAMTIGFIVLAGIGYLYIESRQAFRSMDNLSRMQESARYALETIARDIRMAGYRGCASSNGDFYNTLNDSGTSAYNFGLPINGYDGDGGVWTPALPSDTGGLGKITGPTILPGTDAIILRSALGGGVTVTKEPGKTSAVIMVTAPNDLEPGDIVMVTNCKAATVLQITAPYGKGEEIVVHNTGAGSPGNSIKDLVENYSASGGELIKMQSKSYFIRTGASGRAALWQFDNYKPAVGDNPAEIAEGVENMQILYGIDANADGVVESYSAATAALNWSQVAAVRISLLVAGNDDNVATSKQKYNYNGALVDATDQRLRQVFTTTVSVRNRTQ